MPAATDIDAVFLDTNVLVYANVAEAPFHRRALATLRELHGSGAEIWISRQVLREYLAVVTRPGSFVSHPPLATIIQRVRFFEQRFRVAEDTAAVLLSNRCPFEEIRSTTPISWRRCWSTASGAW